MAAQAYTRRDHSAVNATEKKLQTATAAYTMLESQVGQIRSDLKEHKATAPTGWASPTGWSVVNKLLGRSDPISVLETQLQEAEKKRTAAKKDVDRLAEASRKEQLAKEAQNRANRLRDEVQASDEVQGSQLYFLNRSVNVPGYTSTSTLSDTQKSLFKASVEGSTETEEKTPPRGVVDSEKHVSSSDDSSSDDSSSCD